MVAIRVMKFEPSSIREDNGSMMNRREFGQRSAVVVASVAMRGAGFAATPASRAAARASLLQPVTHDQVQISGPLRDQFDRTMQTILLLEDDAMLYPFRSMQSLPAPGASLPGWYAPDGFAPGHSFGQWMSALARYYAATGSGEAQAKLARLVALYADSMRPDGLFFANNHFPTYTYDKLLLGLMDAHTLANDRRAWSILPQLTTIAAPFLPAHAISRDEMCKLPHDRVHYCYDESYTLPENQFLAWRLTGDPRYLATGKRLLNDAQFFNPLAAGQNALINQHAYSHMNELSSGAQAYLTLGDAKYLEAVKNAFRLVEEQSYATGGWGPEEAFVDPATDRLYQDMAVDSSAEGSNEGKGTHRGFETPCGAYAHLKLGRYLLQITGDPRYGDSMERVLYNTVAGALPLETDGRAFYYSDYNWRSSKTYFPDRWPCCSGTLPMVAADYGISSYFRDARGVFVNLYLPSTLRFTSSNGTRVSLVQNGDYPFAHNASMRMETSRPAKFALRLRIPAWAQGAEVRVNGKMFSGPVGPGTFAAIDREWKSGDRIDLALPLPMRLQELSPHHPELVALLRGPICLFAVTDKANTLCAGREQLLGARVQGSPGAPQAEIALERSALQGGAQDSNPTIFKPFHSLRQDEKYSLYVTAV